jgi:hypothetical protein
MFNSNSSILVLAACNFWFKSLIVRFFSSNDVLTLLSSELFDSIVVLAFFNSLEASVRVPLAWLISAFASVNSFSRSLTFARRSSKNRPSTDCFFSGFSSALDQSMLILYHFYLEFFLYYLIIF